MLAGAVMGSTWVIFLTDIINDHAAEICLGIIALIIFGYLAFS